MRKLKLALDWTPNTNHTGFYVAIEKGWFAAANIELEIIPPSLEYGKHETPAKRVVDGLADLCVCPSESVISCWTSEPEKRKPIAIAAVMQNDTSAIVTLASSGIDRVEKLDGKVYASYEGRFEMGIIKQMIKNSGGEGLVKEIVPLKLDCFDAVLRGEADATWIFLGWEGIIAKRKGIALNEFKMVDSAVPYGYSPVLLASPELVTDQSELLKSLLTCCEKGYQYATTHPEDAALCLISGSQQHASLLQLGQEMVITSQQYVSNLNCYLTSDGRWGRMSMDRWKFFIDFLISNQLVALRDGTVVQRNMLEESKLVSEAFLP